jgi:hypothetical protein
MPARIDDLPFRNQVNAFGCPSITRQGAIGRDAIGHGLTPFVKKLKPQ